MNDEALTADADGTADGLIQEDALPCPGCGGEWVEGVCGRCGLSRSEAVGLLWEQTADAYAAARSAALSGRFRNARQLLQPFLSGGLETEYLRKLDALCASVLGEHQPMESPGALVLAQSDYTAAYRAADSGDFGVAVLLAERCVESAPCLLPAQKLCILALAGAGRTDAADLRRSRLAALLPQEPDITRWALAASPSLVPSPKKLARQGKPLRRRLVSPMSKATPMSKAAVPQRRPQWRGGAYWSRWHRCFWRRSP